MGIFCVLGDKFFSYSFFVSFFFVIFLRIWIWYGSHVKTKLIPHVIVKILEVVAYSNPQQLQGWRSARWQQFKLHLADFNWFNDRSKLKGLDQSVAFDMKGHKL